MKAERIIEIGKELYEFKRNQESPVSSGERLLFDACVAMQELQAELDRHRWIPVSERLPHIEPLIIVETTELSQYYLLEYDQKERKYRDSISGLWTDSYIKSITINWMEIILPEGE